MKCFQHEFICYLLLNKVKSNSQLVKQAIMNLEVNYRYIFDTITSADMMLLRHNSTVHIHHTTGDLEPEQQTLHFIKVSIQLFKFNFQKKPQKSLQIIAKSACKTCCRNIFCKIWKKNTIFVDELNAKIVIGYSREFPILVMKSR